MTNLMQPKYSIGDKVFTVGTQGAQDTVQCPDCLGEKQWFVASPAGWNAKTECPRCRGAGNIRKQLCFKPSVQELTIGSVRMNTADKEDVFTYMCLETGVGSGSVYRESKLCGTEKDAMAASQIMAADQTAQHAERTIDPNRDLRLYDLPYKDAEIKAAKDEQRNAVFAYQRLVERICEIDAYPVAGGEFADEPSASLTEAQVRSIQNSLVWLDEAATKELLAYREENPND